MSILNIYRLCFVLVVLLLSACGSPYAMWKTLPYFEQQYVLHDQPKVGDWAVYTPMSDFLKDMAIDNHIEVVAIENGKTRVTKKILEDSALGAMRVNYTFNANGKIGSALIQETINSPSESLSLFGTQNPKDKLLFWRRFSLPKPQKIKVPAGTFMVTEVIEWGMRQDQGILGDWEAVIREYRSPDVPFGMVLQITNTKGKAEMLELLNIIAEMGMGAATKTLSNDAIDMLERFNSDDQHYETVWGLASFHKQP